MKKNIFIYFITLSSLAFIFAGCTETQPEKNDHEQYCDSLGGEYGWYKDKADYCIYTYKGEAKFKIFEDVSLTPEEAEEFMEQLHIKDLTPSEDPTKST